MRGDFSIWRNERRQNFTGVLHQQGRVLLDADWNAQTAITNDWQDTAAQDIIGAGVAAVPSDQANGFKIKSAAVNAGKVELRVAPGRVWADGLLAELYGEPDPDVDSEVTRIAAYLTPPVQDPEALVTSIVAGTKDAVILEVWREEINGFQMPELLVEPALGGPDTTERIHTSLAFRLMRLTANDTCENIRGRLRDNFATKGKLKATLQPAVAGTGDCPTVAGGGYTGFEHNLYRIEIANVNAGAPQFKWSQYGGGLVGRGHFAAGKVAIKANLQAIINSGLSSFYLEAVEYDQSLGRWRVTYGATATLSNDVLTLGATVFGPAPPSNPNPTDTTFFRLWNGIALVSSFAHAQLPNALGIFLDFDAPSGSNYVPGDFWTFPVRAGEITNIEPLVGKDTGGGTFVGVAPQGIHYHRVPLAVLTWASNVSVQTPIEDCRHVFQPLTRLATCCSYRVGDGMESWGDFETIKDALLNLPADGGEICVLPGEYRENIEITGKRNITIKGCGSRSRVVSVAGVSDPVFDVKESQNIQIQSLLVQADNAGIGILLEGRPLEDVKKVGALPLLDVRLENLLVRAAEACAIEVQTGYNVTIRHCRTQMKDVATTRPAIYFVGEDSLIEENEIVVEDIPRQLGGFDVINPLDPNSALPVEAALGGLHLGGGCERIRVINNVIARGISHGITLGSQLVVTTDTGEPLPQQPEPTPDNCRPCRNGNNSTTQPSDPTTTIVSQGDLYDILIERNRIFNMGLNGISVVGFFPLGKMDEFISVHTLVIQGNEIRRCLYRPLEDILQPMVDEIGYGGVALADVDDLVIRDNFIIDNGPDFRQPICGIFVLHGEGIEISRNHILNNGAKPADSKETADSVKRGRRGGINIVFALAPVVPMTIGEKTVPAQGGYPALKVHDNVVSVPLGQALSVTALGPVSVVGNQFTSRGMSIRNWPTFLASTVAILNLGLSNELYLQLIAFALLGQANLKSAGDGRPGLDDEQLGMFLSNGNVLFTNNQCSLDLMERGISISFSSVLILSLDDVGFHNNQCDANLLDDFVIAQAIIAGMSVRISDNRFKEGLFNTFLSAITAGLFFNTTTDNQSTHCLWIIGAMPNLTVDHSNVSLMMINNPTACCNLLVHKRECFERKGAGK